MVDENKLNLIFIVSDAVRARNLSIYGYHKDTTPTLSELEPKSIIFDRAYACFNATDPSITSMLTGRYPITHGITYHGVFTPKDIKEYYIRSNKSLAQILKSMGYDTLAIDWLERWHKDGFDYYAYYGSSKVTWLKRIVKPLISKIPSKYRTWLHRALMKRIHQANLISASTLTNHAIKIINKSIEKKRNFFLFLHYWDTHFPYNCPKEYKKEFLEEGGYSHKKTEEILRLIKNPTIRDYFASYLKGKTIDEVIAEYDGAIRYVDENIGRIIEFLSKKDLLDSTLIVITSDHGECLGEHGIYFNHVGLYEETVHVPLILFCPMFLKKKKRINAFVQHVDILPTILDILKVNINYDYDGKSLLPLIQGKVSEIRPYAIFEECNIYRKRAIRVEKYKYICIKGKCSSETLEDDVVEYDSIHVREELYDLINDPNESFNLVDEKYEIAQSLKEILSEREIFMKTKVEKRKVKERIKLLRKKMTKNEF